MQSQRVGGDTCKMKLTRAKFNSQKMQPKIQETMSERTGALGSGPGQPLASAASYRLQPLMAQAQSPCPITENVFWADARPIKWALFCVCESRKKVT